MGRRLYRREDIFDNQTILFTYTDIYISNDDDQMSFKNGSQNNILIAIENTVGDVGKMKNKSIWIKKTKW